MNIDRTKQYCVWKYKTRNVFLVYLNYFESTHTCVCTLYYVYQNSVLVTMDAELITQKLSVLKQLQHTFGSQFGQGLAKIADLCLSWHQLEWLIGWELNSSGGLRSRLAVMLAVG